MTAKDEGLWDPVPPIAGLMPVTREDIRHMKSRVRQFTAVAPLADDVVVEVPSCEESFCRWLVVEAAEFATGTVERPVRRLKGKALPALPEANQADESAEEQAVEVPTDYYVD